MSDNKSSNGQSLIMIGIGLMLISAVLAYFVLSQPKASESELVSSTTTSAQAVEAATTQANQAVSEIPQTVTDTTQKTVQDSTIAITSQKVSGTQAQTTSNDASTGYPINLNTCTIDELVEIDGIGESRADAILQYRDYLGGYTSVEQIKNIKGIGDKLFEKVAPYLTV